MTSAASESQTPGTGALKLGAVIIFTDRFDDMKAFYGEVLGLEVKHSDPVEGYEHGVDVIAYKTGEALIELFDANIHRDKLGADWTRWPLVMPGLEVGDVATWLADKGDEVTRLGNVRDEAWGSFAHVVDTDGNPIFLYNKR